MGKKEELEKEFKKIEADMGESLSSVFSGECDLDELLFQIETWKIPLNNLRDEAVNASLKRGISVDEGTKLLKKTLEAERDWLDEASAMCLCSFKKPPGP